MDFDFRQHSGLDETEFRLTAFGLPEPMGVPPVARGRRWYLWFGAAALGTVVLALLCRRGARYFREKRAAARSPVKP